MSENHDSGLCANFATSAFFSVVGFCGSSAKCAYFGWRNHGSRCPKMFWYGIRSMPREAQSASISRTSAAVMGETPFCISGCALYAKAFLKYIWNWL